MARSARGLEGANRADPPPTSLPFPTMRLVPLLLALGCVDPMPRPPSGESPELQAARAAPVRAAAWTGPWTVQLLAVDPARPDIAAAGAALGVVPRAWDGTRPAPPPGTVVVVWAGGGPAGGLLATLERRPGGGGGELVVVVGGGPDPWTSEELARAAWAGAGIVDPGATAAAWTDPRGAPASALGVVAARVVADRYRLPWTPPGEPLPAGLDEWLRPATAADLRSPDPVVRTAAARYRPAALAAEADTLAGDPEVAVRLAVATSTEDPAVRLRLAADPDPLVRARAADRLDDPGRLAELTRDPSSVVRVVAAHRVAARAAEGAVDRPTLVALAAAPDAYQRWKAAWGLGHAEGEVAPLLALLEDVDIDVRRQAALSLARRADPAAVDALVRQAGHANSFVRRWSVQALGTFRDDPRARRALETALDDPAGLVRMEAERALGRPVTPWNPLPPPRDDAEAASRVADADPTVRKDVARFLYRRRDAAAKGWLDTLAADADSEVRKSAVEAMGWGFGAVDRLLPHVDDPDPDVVITALEGIRRSGGGSGGAVERLSVHPDAELRLRAAEAGAGLLPPATVARLVADPDERVRAAVVGLPGAPLDPAEPAALVRAAAAARGMDAGADRLVRARVPEAPLAEVGFADGVLAREDELVHLRCSWNDGADRPSAYAALRPPVIRPYGHPDRG